MALVFQSGRQVIDNHQVQRVAFGQGDFDVVGDVFADGVVGGVWIKFVHLWRINGNIFAVAGAVIALAVLVAGGAGRDRTGGVRIGAVGAGQAGVTESRYIGDDFPGADAGSHRDGDENGHLIPRFQLVDEQMHFIRSRIRVVGDGGVGGRSPGDVVGVGQVEVGIEDVVHNQIEGGAGRAVVGEGELIGDLIAGVDGRRSGDRLDDADAGFDDVDGDRLGGVVEGVVGDLERVVARVASGVTKDV